MTILSKNLLAYAPVMLPTKLSHKTITYKQLFETKDGSWQYRAIRRIANSSDPDETFIWKVDAMRGKGRFVNQDGFRKTIEQADQTGATIILADIFALLGRSPKTAHADLLLIQNLMKRRKLSIYSVRDRDYLNNLPPHEQIIRLQICAYRYIPPLSKPTSFSQARSDLGKMFGKPAPGSKVNQSRADRFAKELKPTIREILQASPKTASLTAIAAELNERKIVTRRGGDWTPTAVKRLLNRLKLDLPSAK